MIFLRISLLLCCPLVCFSQGLSGYVRDEQQRPIEFVNIVIQKEDSSFVEGTLSDSLGYYSFDKTKNGRYRLMAYQSGYARKFSELIDIGDQATPLKYDFTLTQTHVQLGEIVIQAQKPVVVQEPGKITFNVENTVSSAGLMAIDLLKRMPGVQVDNNGNISIKGKTEVLFMIDGKPSYLSARQIAVILRSLPSNQIANIEVITSPSAKYDARGNAGIININLKKTDKKGINGTLNATAGHGILYKSNFGGSVAVGLKKWQINAMYDHTSNRNLEVSTQERNFGGANSGQRYIQNQHYEVPTLVHNYRFSADYTATKKFSLGLSHRGMYTEDRWISTNEGTVTGPEQAVLQRVLSHDYNPNYNSDLALGLNGKYKLDSLGHELSVDGEVSQYKQRSWQNIFTTTWNHDTLSTLDFHAHLPLTNTISNVKLDYAKPLSKALKLETGYKISNVEIANTVEYWIKQTGTFMPRIPSNNQFNYSEQVNAAYATLKWDSTNWSVQLGLRAEHWRARGKLINSSFERDSLQLFPNLQAKYKWNTSHEMSLAASRRVDRPNYLMLNPIAYYIDPYSYYAGSPKILPQSTYNVELAHNYKAGTLVTTLNYSHTRNFIMDFAFYQTSDTSKIQIIGPANIAGSENYGLSTSLYVPVTKSWTSQVYLNVYRNHFFGQSNRYEINFYQTAFTANTTQLFTLPRTWSVELSGNYSSPTIYGYSRNRSMGMLSIGVKRELFAGRVTAKVNFQDIFYTFQYKGNSLVTEMNSSYAFRWDNRVVNLSLVWKLEKKSSLLKAAEKE